jgi:hypothetical protein
MGTDKKSIESSSYPCPSVKSVVKSLLHERASYAEITFRLWQICTVALLLFNV